MGKKEINIDYIGVVKENNGVYTFEQVPIIKSLEIKEQLRAMCENPNRTLLDMQEAFAMKFETDKEGYRCCLPYSYRDSFINWVFYPQLKSYNAYQADKQARIAEIRDAVNKESFVSESAKTQKIEELTAQYERQLKDEFLHAALRYIEAMDFDVTRARINEVDSVKMSSHEFIGWTTMEYPIHKDLTIKVKTNFGYGSSSYFFVNVCYKGIDLLPYSQVVNYYYANMQDIIAHTRSYRAERNSWQIALDFVAGLSDRTQVGLEKLAYEWLRNEIMEMIEGLQGIKRKPQPALAKIAGNRHKDIHLVSVRSMSDNEDRIYKAYPDELALVFKMEKISNALCVLNELEQASIIYPDAIQAIQTIKELNQSIVPELVNAVEMVEHRIAPLREKLIPINCALTDANAQKKEIDEKADMVYERLRYRNHELGWTAFLTEYNKKHPELTELKRHIQQLSETKAALESKIVDRKYLLKRLQKCYSRIADAGMLAA